TRRVMVKIAREHCPGPVKIELAKEFPGVTVNGQVGNGTNEGSLEVNIEANARTGEHRLRLRAVAGSEGAAGAEGGGDLMLTVLPRGSGNEFVNQLKMPMVRIKNGTFWMGSPPEDGDNIGDEVAQHEVAITRDFFLGATEVTRGQFKQFVDDTGYK